MAQLIHDSKRWIIISVVVLVIIGAAIGIFINYSNNSARHEKFVSDLKLANSFKSQLSDLIDRIDSLPSATTKTRADWKAYYDDQTTSLQSIQTSLSQTSFSETPLTTSLMISSKT